MKKTVQIWLAMWLFAGLSVAIAQDRTVSGTVTSEKDGSSVPGVSVAVKGTTRGTLTDASGNYSIGASPNTTLVFSSIGYTTKEAAVGNRSTINLTLAEDTKLLDEVVITQLGIGRAQKSLGYSAQTVKNDELMQNTASRMSTSTPKCRTNTRLAI